MAEHPFWFFLVVACVVWYMTITVYVAVRGSLDIRQMLRNLREDAESTDERAGQK
jgi:hypothetical protein